MRPHWPPFSALLLAFGSLQLYRVDLDSSKRDLPLAGGAVATSERFHRLAWSPVGSETPELPVRAVRRRRGLVSIQQTRRAHSVNLPHRLRHCDSTASLRAASWTGQ